MSQVSKIDELLDTMAGKCHNCGVGHDSNLPSCSEARDEARQALLSAILEVKPIREGGAAVGKNYRSGYAKGNNDALDEWEQAIKELFGATNEQAR